MAPGIQLIAPEEVLRAYTTQLPTGDLVFREANGALVRLIVTVQDPEICNQGDGSFHPADEAAVYQAIQGILPDCVRHLRVEIYLLPYPRSGQLSSSADARAIYLSPGVRSYETEQIAFLVTHEIGHTFHRHFMPDSLTALWAEWAALRGVTDAAIYNADAAHADRPHEIFAEDFRVLFGGAAARDYGAIENSRLPAPETVPGLRAFYERLLSRGPVLTPETVLAFPNPVRAGQTLTLRLPDNVGPPEGLTADLVDVSGRVIAGLAMHRSGAGVVSISLGDGAASRGRLAAGAYWLRVPQASRSRAAVIPIRVLE